MKWMIAALLVASVATAHGADEKKIKFDIQKGELTTLIDMYSKATGQKFVVDPAVRGQISIFLPETVTAEEAFNQLSSALAVNGFAISKQGDTMIVKAARNIQRDYIEVTKEVPSLKPERMVMWIYTFKNVTAMDVNRDLRILPSRDGEMNVNARANQMIMTDWSSNINRIALLMKEVDQPVDAKTAKLVAEGQTKWKKEQASKKPENKDKSKE
jgi:general secretion pathway protein D